jgi:hypothetical protein
LVYFVFKGWLVLQRQQGKLTRTSTCPSAIALSDSDAAIRVRSLRMFLRLFSSLDLFLHGHIRLSVDITKGILVSQLRLKIKTKQFPTATLTLFLKILFSSTIFSVTVVIQSDS